MTNLIMNCSNYRPAHGVLRFVFLLAAGILLLGQPSMALAKTLYVSDELVITFREGMGTQYKIIRTLKTGTAAEILSEDNKEYYKVRLRNGDEGYVLKQYMTDETPKAQVIATLQKQIEKLQSQFASADSGRSEINAQLAESREQLRQTKAQLTQTSTDLQKLQSRYDDLSQKSENVVALSEERDRLSAENGQLTSELTKLRQENSTLLRTAMIQWFLAGGGVFFGGWLIGKMSRKKRRNGFS